MLDEFVAERLGFFISIGFFSVAQVPHLLKQREKKMESPLAPSHESKASYADNHHHTLRNQLNWRF
jgi:hypothetical protein